MKNLSITLFITTISFFSTAADLKLEGEKTTYENTSEDDCTPQWKVEGINDAKGEYVIGNESWTIHFAENGFIAFHTKDGNQDDAIAIKEITPISSCEFGIMMEGNEGEIVPSWTLVYNESGKYYDLKVHSYDASKDTWSDKTYGGSSDNG
ncbi:MAG: hypothetical protein ACI857_002906 [Arenicella sp.]|jgi:hypothetical protein